MSGRLSICCVVCVAVAGAACSQAARQADSELQGAWIVTRIISDGEEAPADEIEGMTYTFAGDKLTMMGPDEGPDVLIFTLDPSQAPRWIDLMDEQFTMLGIYKLDGDTLTIAIRPRMAQDRERPRRFESQDGAEHSVIVLNRPSAPAKPTPPRSSTDRPQ